jgi:hypothetical protein
VRRAPGIPCALVVFEGKSMQHPGGFASRERGLMFSVIASEAKQSISSQKERMDCFASLAMTAELAV